MNSEQDDQDTGKNSGRKRKSEMTEEERAEYKRQKKEAREKLLSETTGASVEAEKAARQQLKHDQAVEAQEVARRKQWDEDSVIHHERMDRIQSTASMASENSNSGRGRFNNCSTSSSAACATSASSSSSADSMTLDQARARNLARPRPDVSGHVQQSQESLLLEKEVAQRKADYAERARKSAATRAANRARREEYPGLSEEPNKFSRDHGTRSSPRLLEAVDYSPDQHLSLPPVENAQNPAGLGGIFIGNSRLPNCDLGVFASWTWKAGDIICPYGHPGSVLGCHNSARLGVYCDELDRTFWGDSTGVQFYGGLINSDNHHSYNCAFHFKQVGSKKGLVWRLFVIALCDIEEFQELSMYYGEHYWNSDRTAIDPPRASSVVHADDSDDESGEDEEGENPEA